uniref:Undecaprenyl-phosphate 4-deoxy-4-formamido-L-arabinose transferase n=1 Tax=Candidatus Methanogaster sp. ANME-2c ERB4 TaxID=2759911 RepID=A0A7G9Y441_9EURY|nr:undecaprenyl-phosphate 4-deoxy-4-formamido-L-arabinose transferase [Methanosarcinales archaeon ANME-2c ERB4]QNO42775.1 undecaprenyl-phosphate 4-deoxy-4-formamido-L-arabinose transferase [Methanosarcinales archaeon ANME-2c ERB4]
MKNNPTVSVVIPTCNRAHLIGRAIQSVLNQSYQDFEIIVVDDGSTDDTEGEIKEFQKRDKRVRYIRHENNKGGSAARNTGIKSAEGDYIALLDDDDEWLPEKIEKQVIKFQNSVDKVGVIYSGFFYVSDKTGEVISESVPTLQGNVYANLLSGCILGSPTPLIRKTCFQKAGLYDDTLPSAQDWDMWIRLSKHYEFDFIPDIMAKHYIHGGQISVDLNAKIRAREKLMRKYQADLSTHPSILSVHLKQLGKLYCLAGQSKEGRKCFLDSIKLNTFQRSSYLHFFLSLLAPMTHRNILRKSIGISIDEDTYYYWW